MQCCTTRRSPLSAKNRKAIFSTSTQCLIRYKNRKYCFIWFLLFNLHFISACEEARRRMDLCLDSFFPRLNRQATFAHPRHATPHRRHRRRLFPFLASMQHSRKLRSQKASTRSINFRFAQFFRQSLFLLLAPPTPHSGERNQLSLNLCKVLSTH